jgi:general nucleoside transport system permease protein
MTSATADQQKLNSFRPGVMQWVIGLLLLVAMILPVLSPMFGRDPVDFATALSTGFTPPRIALLLLVIAGWAFWVWRDPNGGMGFRIPLLAITTAFIVGAVVMILASGEGELLPMERLMLAARGYAAMVDGAFLKENALANTLVAATPLLLTGLGVALGFRAGLFNIGAEGQFMIGAVCGVFVGYAIQLPPIIHAIVVMIAGALGGAFWGTIPGVLKAKLGAHEVINTIMMNFIAIYLADWLINNPMKDVESGSSTIRTAFIHPSANLAQLGELFPETFDGNPLHIGFFIAVGLAIFVWWLLWKTTIGFELRTAGSNLDAARYAGMRADRTIILAMALSGALAGLAGAIQIQGVTRNLPAFFSAGYGFDAIAVALLAFNHPIAVIPAGLLFGGLQTGSEVLQIRTGVSKHIVSIIQALILLFVAAPALIRWIYRVKSEQGQTEQVAMTRGWGG